MYFIKFFYLWFLVSSIFLYFVSLYFLSFSESLIIEYNFMNLNSILFSFYMIFDWVSFMFISFVFFISSLILLYSYEYMEAEKFLKRFIYLMILFILSMMFMILSPSLVSILLGWDGLGLVSYLLVIFYQNTKSYNAGMLTILSNRLGDAALLMSIGLMMDIGSWNLLSFMSLNLKLKMILFYIILAAITKSAQIPFSSWLPAAMAAPTPVSSLVHSSTLVTAGVYILFRFDMVLIEEFKIILLFLSFFTMVMAGLGANFEYDLKKIIALSTLSQLGMMLSILCLGNSDLAFFHLLIHALFKALLFMCAGAIIHSFMDVQDIRNMGGLMSFLPVTCTCFMVSNFSLCGLPFLSGFYSKDLIMEIFSMKLSSILIYTLFYISIGLTVAYSIRLSYYLIFSDFNFFVMVNLSDENNSVMMKSMLMMIFLVIFKGSVGLWLMFPVPYFILLPYTMKLLTIVLIFMGGLIGLGVSKMYYFYNLNSLKLKNLSFFLGSMWNLPFLSISFNFKMLLLGKNFNFIVDQGWFEYYGSKNFYKNLMFLFIQIQLLSKNHLKIFLLLMMTFIMFMLILIFVC
uniref:NADH-ubiquinone oxidoreductase chain 5 n=1 Tax=Cryptorhynchinae sp. 8 ACP-2013 TaxID=1434469 RepID=A0A3G3ME62_9CUCU|nr:NADH dehydrogenase subunit 5 [Cryptorhynchinae sp. 8 ACP-2013]